MTLEKIIEIADKAYGDGLVDLCAADDTRTDDTLALFVARELKNTYDPNASDYAQIKAAQHAMTVAISDLSYVEDAFTVGWDHLKKEANG
jgi:hypothetical protein